MTAPSDEVIAVSTPAPDFNRDIYYRNKLEFSLETGGLPINIPFVFDVFVGGDYSQRPLRYTLVPIFPSLRWHMGDIKGPGILRGNTDLTATISVTAIPRGPEKIYGAFDLGVRRNFVHRNWRTAPYFEFRLGAGFIDAKEPEGVSLAQGQDFTFTLMMGAGARYNFNPRYSMSFGPEYMHVSNLYLSEQHVCPTAGFLHPCYNNGINVWGGMVGFNVRLGKPKQGGAIRSRYGAGFAVSWKRGLQPRTHWLRFSFGRCSLAGAQEIRQRGAGRGNDADDDPGTHFADDQGEGRGDDKDIVGRAL